MHYLILGLIIAFLVYAALRAFVNTNPKTIVKNLRSIGGIAALVLAILMGVTGRFALAVPLIFVAISLLRGNVSGFNPFPGSANKSQGQHSRVRTRTIEMDLDHDTGDMEGRVVAGQFSSRMLSSMDEAELTQLYAECQNGDPQAAQLLDAYMNRRFASWREEHGSDAGASGQAGIRSDGPISREEAYEILGLEPGAGKLDIRRAHRKLMKKLHPDQGGSTYLAAKINEAKDLLLG